MRKPLGVLWLGRRVRISNYAWLQLDPSIDTPWVVVACANGSPRYFEMIRSLELEIDRLQWEIESKYDNGTPKNTGYYTTLQYRDIVDFLNRSKISYAISDDPIVSRPYLKQFWETADHDCTVTPNFIRATVAGHDIAISEDTIRRVMQFRDLATDPVTYPDYFVDGCRRQRMGYVGARDYASYKKMWKAGKDVMGHDLVVVMVGLSLNKGYNFSKYIYKAITDQINTAEKFRLLLYPRFVQLLINDALPNLPAIGERIQVKKVAKRVFSQFLTSGSVEPTPVHTPLFGHLINEAYVAPSDLIWFSAKSESELSELSDEQIEVVKESLWLMFFTTYLIRCHTPNFN
ncbi:hypothetical protein L1987_53079 [Smallanthus sonchifolius]|uniref:Uncharacterized protein n=1 Tax=Smallanthus sonchifolius TaxID=185202 RepID=A0ACB9EV91_9ASTR|nr:hypothetical protein L1987_53079 [Smallanthus sonchifolius]